MAGGFALLSNGDIAHADSTVSNDVSNVSDDNVSSDDDLVVTNDVSSNDAYAATKDISLGNIPKEVSLNNVVQIVDDVAGNNVPTKFMGVAAYTSLNGDSNVIQIGDNQPYDPWANINKSDYALSPYYDEHIFVKIGEDFTDKYAFCVEHGAFIPLGNITKEIANNRICDLSCGINDCYFDLSSPYIYDDNDVSCFLETGEFAPETMEKQENYWKDYYATNYRQVDGQDDVYVNVHQDFTDKYILCMDCGRYVPLGNVTTPLKDVMICNHPTHFGEINYFDVDHPAVVTPEQAIDSWYPFYEDLYSNPDYHPIHSDEPGYGEDAYMPDDNSFEEDIVVNDQPSDVDFNYVVYTGNVD